MLFDDEARELLTDAMVMLENIERNREMPPFAQTLQQYVALGHKIREALAQTEKSDVVGIL